MSCYRTPIVAVPTVILEQLTNPSKMKFLALHWSGSCWGDSAVPCLVYDGGGLAGSGTGACLLSLRRLWLSLESVLAAETLFLLLPTLKT